ncbi:aminotransferase class I/II-fold pyridoxal phosphate-dependent enzyme [Streptomyces sp. H10-C2]|uniref:aminotransferase class I/II-fold pyridoxal phosphate-dependent enzyme n=1 Tax=unclassified Streptomyces TaxID=2593676 RepID=UPI0024B99AE5|nr:MULTISPECIES: aminotransferase class I/II-fold pyridoxal phosphate-dependent enzyme [unclassified Streptomyces]MDJ0343532.1 aminotransferase class I/II-fold pyridoxal phosphate-dependent enzyme [Streptomyces sp. PH10-H1]MDJ0368892.1 aminotransferase class I/II-fold pyridoxal phosphate-dependent enzyme [Streptomyces sp. H10-C2]
MTDYLAAAAQIQASCGIPVVADVDTGFGGNMNVAHMVREYERAGVTAVCIEDKHFPKMNSFVDKGQVLLDADDFYRKLQIAKAAQESPEFYVIARGVPVHPEGGRRTAARSDQAYQNPAGDAALRRAIARQTTRRSGVLVDPEQVLVAPGARLAIHCVLTTVLGERPEVLLPAPYWVSCPQLVAMAGGTTVRLPAQVGDGHLDVGVLEAHRTAATDVLVVNSPRNPDGAVTPAESLGEIVERAGRHGIVVPFDEVYRGVPVTAEPAPSVLDIHPRLPAHCVVIDGLSKSHALAGLRVGWAIADEGLTRRAAAVTSHLFGGTSTAVQEIAEAMLDGGEDVRTGIGAAPADNLRYALKQLADVPGVSCADPAGGIFLFPDLRRWLAEWASAGARENLAGWLAEEGKVAVVDGAAFGAPGHLRLSFALPAEQLEEGVDRLRTALTAPAHQR